MIVRRTDLTKIGYHRFSAGEWTQTKCIYQNGDKYYIKSNNGFKEVFKNKNEFSFNKET